MITDTKEFLNEFRALLDKYNVEIEITDDSRNYDCTDLGLEIEVKGKDGKGYDLINQRGIYIDKESFKEIN
jgi:hypothetical protein